MKVIKDNEHSVLIRHFNIENKHYLSLSTMLYYDLLESKLLDEQQMWSEITPFLRSNQPLDEAYPKVKAEFLAYGNCYSDTPVLAKQVSIKVGELEKSLDVIGNRYYKKKLLNLVGETEPEDFQKIKIGFENAYGGEGFPLNPIGKGYLNSKKELKNNPKLNNIDSSSHLSASSKKEYKVLPQSYEAMSLDWKFRKDKSGTYDDNWERTRWPYFPDDIEKSFFNTALPDQWFSDYLKGDEEIVIKNMHPTKSLIKSYLPGIKVRSFITKIDKKDYFSSEVLKEEFIELENKIDTVIIFTDLAKVVIVYRSTTECYDEEYINIKDYFTTTENPNISHKNLEFYKELKERKETNPLELEEIEHDTNALSKKFLDIPRRLNFETLRLKKNLLYINPLPSQSIRNEQNKINLIKSKFESVAKNGIEDIVKKYVPNYSSKLLATRHYLTISNNVNTNFSRISNLIENKKKKITSTLNKKGLSAKESVDKVTEDFKKAHQKSISDKITKNVETLNVGINEESFSNNQTSLTNSKSWEEAAIAFIGNLKYQFYEESKAKKDLEDCGFRDVTYEISSICYNNEKYFAKAKEWNVEQDFVVDKGYIIPITSVDKLMQIIVRPEILKRDDENKKILLGDDNDIVVFGSKNSEIVILGMNESVVIICDDVLKAWLINQDLYDIATVVVFKKEEDFLSSKYFAQNKENLKTIISVDVSLKGKDLEKYKIESFLFNKSDFLEKFDTEKLRKDVINLIDEGEFKESLLKEEHRKEKMGVYYRPNFKSKDFTQTLNSLIDKDLQRKVSTKIKTVSNKLKQTTLSESGLNNLSSLAIKSNLSRINKRNIMGRFYETSTSDVRSLINTGKNVITDAKNKLSLKRVEGMYNSKASSLKSNLKGTNYLNSDIRGKLSQFKQMKKFVNVDKLTQQIDRRLPNLSKIQNKGPFSEKTSQEFKNNFNIDINEEQVIFSSVEEVLNHYNSGKSFVNTVLENLEISDINLEGADFKGSNFSFSKFENVNFKYTNLEGVDFTGTKLINCNFAKSKLVSSKLIEVSFDNSDLCDVDFSKSMIICAEIKNSKFNSSIFNSVVFITNSIDDSDFKNVNFDSITFDKPKINNSNFDGAKFNKSFLSEPIISNSSFKKSSILKGAILKGNLNDLIFDNSLFEGVLVHKETKFERLSSKKINIKDSSFIEMSILNSDFTNSMLENVNFNSIIIENSVFEDSEAKSSGITRSKIINSNFSKSDFMYGSFRKSYFKVVDFSRSNLYGADFFDIKVNKFNLKNSNIKKTLLAKNNLTDFVEEIEC